MKKNFWNVYSDIEKKKIYTTILSKHNEVITGTVETLYKKFNVELDFFVGFLDGINESIKTTIKF